MHYIIIVEHDKEESDPSPEIMKDYAILVAEDWYTEG